eukprot:4700392-Pyramimonas_sp.AAC.1
MGIRFVVRFVSLFVSLGESLSPNLAPRPGTVPGRSFRFSFRCFPPVLAVTDECHPAEFVIVVGVSLLLCHGFTLYGPMLASRIRVEQWFFLTRLSR